MGTGVVERLRHPERSGAAALARLQKLKEEADVALDNMSLNLNKPTERPQSRGKKSRLVPVVAVVLALFGTITIITSHGSHITSAEEDAFRVSWHAFAHWKAWVAVLLRGRQNSLNNFSSFFVLLLSRLVPVE